MRKAKKAAAGKRGARRAAEERIVAAAKLRAEQDVEALVSEDARRAAELPPMTAEEMEIGREQLQRLQRADELAARLAPVRDISEWMIRQRVLKSALLIWTLREHIIAFPGSTEYFDRVDHIDCVWREIVTIRDVVPLVLRLGKFDKPKRGANRLYREAVAILLERGFDSDAKTVLAELQRRAVVTSWDTIYVRWCDDKKHTKTTKFHAFETRLSAIRKTP